MHHKKLKKQIADSSEIFLDFSESIYILQTLAFCSMPRFTFQNGFVKFSCKFKWQEDAFQTNVKITQSLYNIINLFFLWSFKVTWMNF